MRSTLLYNEAAQAYPAVMDVDTPEDLTMNTTSSILALAAAVGTSLLLTMGTANAADNSTNIDGPPLSIDGHAQEHNTRNDTDTFARNSGPGGTSVNAAGGRGYASQFADQHKPDSSSHRTYQNNARTDSHDDTNSHNSTINRDSHNTTEVSRAY
jgi:hypothetical protein